MSRDPIVVGTDGSVSAQLAVDRAGELGQALGATVHVVSSYAPTAARTWMAAAAGVAAAELAMEAEQAEAGAEEIVARARDGLEERGISVRTHVCSSDAAEALITIADDEHAQMIVVGNRGMTGARRVLGSVPNRVSHHARCDVLIVPTC
jgi:nucleotide-binding universal stress UspA family protein